MAARADADLEAWLAGLGAAHGPGLGAGAATAGIGP